MKKLLLLSLIILASCGDNDIEEIETDPCRWVTGECWEFARIEVVDTRVCGLYGGQQVFCSSYYFTAVSTCDGSQVTITTPYLDRAPAEQGEVWCNGLFERTYIN